MSSSTKMQYVRLGTSGLKVSRIILGCMSYGHPKWGGNWVLGEEEASKHIAAAYAAGINTFDTADGYSNGLSEEILGRAIKKHNLPRDEIVVMTKLFLPVSKNPEEVTYTNPDFDGAGFVNQHGLSRKHIFDGVRNSLRRLGSSFRSHHPLLRRRCKPCTTSSRPATSDILECPPVMPTSSTQCKTTRSRITLPRSSRCRTITRSCTGEEEREMMPTLKHFGVGSIPWSPLARGALSRPLSQQSARAETDVLSANYYTQSPASKAIVNRVEEIAKKRGVSMAQISVAWVLAQDAVSAPIVGTTSLANLADIVGAINVKLTEEEIKYLAEPYQPLPIFGH
ncbi:Aldo-ket-red domain-containing protein [Mycena sanguinolenta]|uniref:Aldo-ket-red domain-containing protein n=1 Tax=Mycena sanguinolenta TaxID=230812 RepID=A0A8H6ZAZ1_9AGAR|nr:Aldo-ket-red domain-containing protein [Mycena sanguinolenta]